MFNANSRNMVNLTTLSALFLVFAFGNIKSSNCSSPAEHKEAVFYLKAFGYFPNSINTKEITHKQFHHALRRLQIRYHINSTGKLDDSTLTFIRTPRCGVGDEISKTKRQKRYNLLNRKWEKHLLTWSYNNKGGKYYHEMDKIRRTISEALERWTEITTLSFQEISDYENADIRMSFERQYHTEVDTYPFNTEDIAHAFPPGPDLGGDVHFRVDHNEWDFDAREDGSAKPGTLSFYAVAIHEIGHALGLSHSENLNAVMYSWATTSVFHRDDIEGIQHIYGVSRRASIPGRATKSTTLSTFVDTVDNDEIDEPETTSEPKLPQKPDRCKTSYDSIARIHDELFIFKDKYMWRPDTTQDTYEIRQLWHELPENLERVDAVYQKSDGNILFFIGRRLLAFSSETFLYESSLSRLGIDGAVDKIDAIFKWDRNDRTYIFSGDRYWRFDEGAMRVEQNYPMQIMRIWRNVYDIDTAFSSGGKLLMFKGLSYYEFNDRTMRLNRMNPVPSAPNWMKCAGAKILLRSGFDDSDSDIIHLPEDEDEIPEDIENPEKITPATGDAVSVHRLLKFLTPIILLAVSVISLKFTTCP